MTAYLHIGTTNTGNQEKQGFLMQNEERLLKKGYIYPKSLRVANRALGFGRYGFRTSSKRRYFAKREYFKSYHK